MTETTLDAQIEAPPPPEHSRAKLVREEEKKDDGIVGFLLFVLKLALVVLAFRSFAFAPFSIPSESMLPRLQIGDYLLASKWNYGFSNYSLPFGRHLFPKGRLFASQPERGDIVIFKAPPTQREDYIKRVIGLPGDQIQMVGGTLFINGIEVRKQRIEDFVQPIDDAMLGDAEMRERVTPCFALRFEVKTPDGRACRYPQFTETLPNGVSYRVLDFGTSWADDTPPRVVPDGMLFVMGDNRDNSMDSRYPAAEGQGVGLVPQDNLEGKAAIMVWSTDGSVRWYEPWTWFTATRWSRIGGRL